MRAMICGCGERLETAGDKRMVEEVATHLKRVHPGHLVASLSREQLPRVVANRAYKLEYALVYVGGRLDEEFGLNPY